MEIIENTEKRIGAYLSIGESLANAIRRSVNEIDNIAISDVEIYKNDSALYDEVVAHRLGLIPITSNRKLEEVKNSKPTMKSEIKLSLKIKGPGIVYAKDLKGEGKAIYPDMPIVILNKDQEVELIAFARLGKGEEHAKFSPGLCYYRKSSDIKIKSGKDNVKIVEGLKDSVIKGKLSGKIGESFTSYLDEDFVESLEGSENLEITPGGDIVLFVESWGQILPKEILQEAIKALDRNLKEVSKALKG